MATAINGAMFLVAHVQHGPERSVDQRGRWQNRRHNRYRDQLVDTLERVLKMFYVNRASRSVGNFSQMREA